MSSQAGRAASRASLTRKSDPTANSAYTPCSRAHRAIRAAAVAGMAQPPIWAPSCSTRAPLCTTSAPREPVRARTTSTPAGGRPVANESVAPRSCTARQASAKAAVGSSCSPTDVPSTSRKTARTGGLRQSSNRPPGWRPLLRCIMRTRRHSPLRLGHPGSRRPTRSARAPEHRHSPEHNSILVEHVRAQPKSYRTSPEAEVNGAYRFTDWPYESITFATSSSCSAVSRFGSPICLAWW